MDSIPESSLLTWKHKRRNTFIGFIIIGAVVGIDGSIITSTLYLYLRDMVKTDKPKMYYGLILAVFYVTSAIFGAFSGRWLDNTRKTRYYVNFVILVQIIGFIFYIIPYPATLLVGRSICGIGEPFPSVITGEVCRIYDNKEGTRKLFLLGSVYSLGFIIGPAFNAMFTGIEFKIGPLEINYLNFTGIFMVGLLLLVLVIANFLVHDCSAEIDLKAILKHTGSNKEIAQGHSGRTDGTDGKIYSKDIAHDYLNNKEITCGIGEDGLLIEEMEIDKCTEAESLISKPSKGELNHKNTLHDENAIPVKLVFIFFASNMDFDLIFVATLILVYTVYGATVVFPLLIINDLKWNLMALSGTIAGFGVGYLIFLILLSTYCRSSRAIYYAWLLSILSLMPLNAILICFKLLQRNIARDISMVVLFSFFLVFSWSGEDALLRIMLAKMVPSKIQCFSETLRSVVTKITVIVASLSVPVLTPWLHWWACGMFVPVVLLLLGYIIRRKYFIKPQEITFSDN